METKAGYEWSLASSVSATVSRKATIVELAAAACVGHAATSEQDKGNQAAGNKAGGDKAGGDMADEKQQEEKDAELVRAAVRMQSATRGRLTRHRAAKMSRSEGDALWYGKIKPVITRIFRDIGGQDKSIDIEEFVRWINEEWRNMRFRQKLEKKKQQVADAAGTVHAFS